MTTTSTRLGELVDRFGGQLIGSPDITVIGIAPLSDADHHSITFLSNSKLRHQASSTRAAALILTESDYAQVSQDYAGACIIAPNPYVYFARAAQYFASLVAIPPALGIHPTAWVSPHAVVAATASIGPHVSIDAEAVVGEDVVIKAGTVIGRGVSIGDNTLLHGNVSVYDHCIIGAQCIIHSGAVIGANTSIDRGALADTVIENGVILDNQIQIGHNCHIGENTAMAGCVGVAGSAKIGKNCTFGGAAMVLGHLTIVDNVHISSASMVSRSILEPGQYTGFYPLAKNADWEKSAAIVRNLSGLREKIRQLEKTIKTLTEKSS